MSYYKQKNSENINLRKVEQRIFMHKNIFWYLENKCNPIYTTIYVHKQPEYLENFNNGLPNLCEVHGLHSEWSFKPNRKMGNYKYNIFRCKKCDSLGALWWHYRHPIKAMLKDAKVHARNQKIFFDLSLENLFKKLKYQKNRCKYTGEKFSLVKNRPSLDQIIPKSGYTSKNVQVVLKEVNIMKSNFSEDYFLNLIRLVNHFRVEKKGFFSPPNLVYETNLEIKNREYVEKKIKSFETAGFAECKTHGMHGSWRVEIDKRYGSGQIICKICKYEKAVKSRVNRIGNGVTIYERVKARQERFQKTGKIICNIHGEHASIVVKNNNRDIRCKKCEREKRLVYYNKYPLKAIFLARKSKLRSNDKVFSISFKELEEIYKNQNGRCWYTGIPLEKGKMGGISMDRFNNEVGYTAENVRLCFADINRMKSNINYQKFIHLVSSISLNSNKLPLAS